MKLPLMLAGGLAMLLTPVPVAAQNSPAIVEARAAGVIGERYDGYLGYAKPTGAALRNQVDGVNIRRRSLFTSLAAQRNASPQEVGIATGCELLGAVAVGEAYLLPDNIWRRRGPGQTVPLPGYCRR